MIRESLPLTDERLHILEAAAVSTVPSFAEDVRRGLTADPKVLFPRYFYDALGSPSIKDSFWKPLVDGGGEVLPPPFGNGRPPAKGNALTNR